MIKEKKIVDPVLKILPLDSPDLIILLFNMQIFHYNSFF